jgi:hypothetical protein
MFAWGLGVFILRYSVSGFKACFWLVPNLATLEFIVVPVR